MTRKIENSDLWGAVRGLRMFGATDEELREHYARYKSSVFFAGQVIAEAARQLLVSRRVRVE